jgi:hypothetical protein
MVDVRQALLKSIDASKKPVMSSLLEAQKAAMPKNFREVLKNLQDAASDPTRLENRANIAQNLRQAIYRDLRDCQKTPEGDWHDICASR